jgi:hypothetical protein
MTEGWLIAVLVALTLAVLWVGWQVMRLHRDIAPIATSPLAGVIAEAGR